MKVESFKVQTTHDYNEQGECHMCGLHKDVVLDHPVCKMDEGDKKWHTIEVTVANTQKKLDGIVPEVKTFTHAYDGGGVCVYCQLKEVFEFRYPTCPAPEEAKRERSTTTKKGKGKSHTTLGPVCHASHPVLKFGELEIFGGSCNNPKVKGCDVYIGFDQGMKMTKWSMPWRRGAKGSVEEVFFYVRDMRVPTDSEEFARLVDWTLKQMKEGKKVHAGCIGGHGRTGTFFAALAARQTEVVIEDCVSYVRENYCEKAVESKEQIAFLKTHFDVDTKCEPSKKHVTTAKITKWDGDWSPTKKSSKKSKKRNSDSTKITPKPSAKNIWGSTLDEGDL